jgi:uncharacterized protein DUF4154
MASRHGPPDNAWPAYKVLCLSGSDPPALLWNLLLWLLLWPLAASAQETPLSEYQLKAAFVYNFAKFVEWPADAFPSATSPFIVGVVGDNPFEGHLERAVQDKNINGHPLVVKQLKGVAEIKKCQILFISSSERKRLAEILRAARGASILTISELDHFLPAGGMIQFLMEDNKVRFAINDAAAKEAGLRISSKLLNLAKHSDNEASRR